jgi:hypothetical protein
MNLSSSVCIVGNLGRITTCNIITIFIVKYTKSLIRQERLQYIPDSVILLYGFTVRYPVISLLMIRKSSLQLDSEKLRRRCNIAEDVEEVEPKAERYVKEVVRKKRTKGVKEDGNQHKHEKAQEDSGVHDLLKSQQCLPNTVEGEYTTDALANEMLYAACTKTYEDVLRARASLSAATAAADNACIAADNAVRATLKMMIALKQVNSGILK